MATTPPPQRDRKMMESGSKLLLLGGVLAAVGIVLMIVTDSGTPKGIGVAIASLATVPTLAGLGLWLSGVVSRRSRANKPFA